METENENKIYADPKEAKCHDCGKEIEVEGEVINNGVYLSYDTTQEDTPKKINIFKTQVLS